MSRLDKSQRLVMDNREWVKFGVLVGAFGLLGLTAGMSGFLVFTGLGLLTWIIWRGHRL